MFEENLKIWVDEIKNQGRAEGIAIGRAEGKYDIAKNLINMGLSVDQIEKATGLESSVIHDIKTNKK